MTDTGQTIPQVEASILTAQVETNWPGTNSIVGYYNPTTMKPLLPTSSPDYLLYWVMQQILNVRNQDEPAFARDTLETLERQDLVDDILARLTKGKTQLDAVITAITAYRATL